MRAPNGALLYSRRVTGEYVISLCLVPNQPAILAVSPALSPYGMMFIAKTKHAPCVENEVAQEKLV